MKTNDNVTSKTLDTAIDLLDAKVRDYADEILKSVNTNGEITVALSIKIKRITLGKSEVETGVSFSTGKISDKDKQVVDEGQMEMFPRIVKEA